MVILFYSLLGVESAVKMGPPPVKGWGLWVVVFMPQLSSLIKIMVGVGVIIVIINDPSSSWQVGHRQININCGHHRRQHQLWSSSSLASTVVIIIVGRGHRRRSHHHGRAEHGTRPHRPATPQTPHGV